MIVTQWKKHKIITRCVNISTMYIRYTEINYNSITYLIEKFLGISKPHNLHQYYYLFFMIRNIIVLVVLILDILIQIRRFAIFTIMKMNFPTRATQKVFAHVRLIYVVHKLASSETIWLILPLFHFSDTTMHQPNTFII